MNDENEVTIQTNAKITCHDVFEMKLRLDTTGFMGGDSGHGGRTLLTFDNSELLNFEISAISGDQVYSLSNISQFNITAGGDAELRILATMFEFIANQLAKYKCDSTQTDTTTKTKYHGEIYNNANLQR